MKATFFAAALAAIATGVSALPAPIGAQGLIARDEQAQAAQQDTQKTDQAAASQQVQNKQQQAEAAGTQEQQDAKATQGMLSTEQQQAAQNLAATSAWCYTQSYGYYACDANSYYDQHVCQNTYNGQWYYCSYSDWYQQYFGYNPPQCYDYYGNPYPCGGYNPNPTCYYNGYAYPCNQKTCYDPQGVPQSCLLGTTESASVKTPFGTFSGSRTTTPDSSNPNGGTVCTYDSNGNVITCTS
ncbi:hypothetical protein CERZMDRAFT_95807 [Cercospora zeae-maydis SCOH1-5]|uniref:Uncharacterized protein n=1 Tax=Cercospora zeae-maydis SCOH1-5 TaxID=717836 RepID=A0A6A6FM53_9PEZI|nr:hypothetical protein CERZMDRAFT_95807 [Cercospora zeae-maydis SCOH1-5]